jgi:hypothetical protein
LSEVEQLKSHKRLISYGQNSEVSVMDLRPIGTKITVIKC